jgi:hypothetical protein
MPLRLPSLIPAFVSVLLAGVATAASEDPGMTVCSRMLEASLPRPVGTARPFRIEFLNRGHVDTDAAYSAGEFTYDLRALAAGSGREVVTASCTVKEDGQVVAMRFDPRAAVAPSLASRL